MSGEKWSHQTAETIANGPTSLNQTSPSTETIAPHVTCGNVNGLTRSHEGPKWSQSPTTSIEVGLVRPETANQPDTPTRKSAMDRTLRHESDIEWTEDITRLDYVREYIDAWACTRRRPVPWRGPGRRVGYSLLTADAPNNGQPGFFTRRVFWVNDHDRSEQPEGIYRTGAPVEAVDPRTVRPGAHGEITERAWGGPLTTRTLDVRYPSP